MISPVVLLCRTIYIYIFLLECWIQRGDKNHIAISRYEYKVWLHGLRRQLRGEKELESSPTRLIVADPNGRSEGRV